MLTKEALKSMTKLEAAMVAMADNTPREIKEQAFYMDIENATALFPTVTLLAKFNTDLVSQFNKPDVTWEATTTGRIKGTRRVVYDFGEEERYEVEIVVTFTNP